jgi:hypothetical protein
MFIPDPNFSIPDPGSRVKKILAASKTQRCFLTLGNMIRFVRPGSGSRMRILDADLDFFTHIPDPGVKKAPDPGSATLLRTRIQEPRCPRKIREIIKSHTCH